LYNLETINSLSFETYYGFKDFTLMYGDISEQPAELIVFSTHAGKGKPSGAVISALHQKFGNDILDFDKMSQIISLTEKSYFNIGAIFPKDEKYNVPANTYLIEPKGNMPFKNILMLRLPGPKYFKNDTPPLNAYKISVVSIFSSIAALEFSGKQYKNISMSLLGGARSFSRTKIMSILLENAIKWLEYSRYTKEINFVIYEKKEIEAWNISMNEALGRTYDTGDYEKSIKELQGKLKEQINGIINNINNNDLKEILKTVSNALTNSKEICIQQFGMYGRKLTECISSQICIDLGLKPYNTIYKNIEQIEKNKKVSKWVNYYLHSLRVLGNESVHLSDKKNRIPESLSSGDLLVIFSNILRVLDFYELWNKNHSKS